MQAFVTEIRKPRRHSLSLNAILVRGLALGNGYGGVHAPTGLHLDTTASAVAGGQLSLVTETVFVVVQHIMAARVRTRPWCGPTVRLFVIIPSLSSVTFTLLTAIEPTLVTTMVYLTLTHSGVEKELVHGCVSVPPWSQVCTPSCGSFSARRVHSGEPGPLLPVPLSGLDESRQSGLQTFRLVSGVDLQEQLVCSTSYTPLMVTLVVVPRFDFPCAVASMVKPFSLAIDKTSPSCRKGRLYVTVAPLDPAMITVAGPLMSLPVYSILIAMAAPVQLLVLGGVGVE